MNFFLRAVSSFAVCPTLSTRPTATSSSLTRRSDDYDVGRHAAKDAALDFWIELDLGAGIQQRRNSGWPAGPTRRQDRNPLSGFQLLSGDRFSGRQSATRDGPG